jgi:catechol 2,3-dioxygenase-like lactoylglutathione lyase family enzyme
MTQTSKPGEAFVGLAERTQARENAVGLAGADHVGLATRDPLLAGRFVEEILGGVECLKAGYSEEDIRLGRPQHIFYHVGNTVLEVAKQNDEAETTAYNAVATRNDQPHWAFGTTAAGLRRFADHLRAQGIPFDGPRSHRGMSAVSVYFRDVDGNNLEVTTWEPFPADQCKPMGGPHGFPVWEQLAHSWRPSESR